MTLGAREDALENYQKAMSANPVDPTVLNNYGRALGLLGRREEAIALYEQAMKNRPGYAPAHESLGKAYLEGGYPEKAFHEYQKALQLDPRLANAHHGLGQLYSSLGGMPYAEHHYREALRIEPSLIHAHIGLSAVARHRGDYEEALRIYSEAEKISPDNPHLLGAKADTLERKGDYDGAYQLLQQLADNDRMVPLAVAAFSRICQKFDVCDDALELIELSVNAPGTDLMEKQILRYAAGTLLDKLKQFDKAIEWFQAANASVTGIPFNPDQLRRNTDDTIACFSKEAMATLPRAQTSSRRPIFILGMPRSGTTLTEQILASHPDVYGAGELSYIQELVYKIRAVPPEATWAAYINTFTEEKITAWAKDYLGKIGQLNADARYLTDKMPHNFQHIGLINLLFPEARIIHCRRNPLDNGLSIYFQNFIWSHDYATDLKNIGIFYREYARLMRHWEQVADIPMMTVDYEDMIENTVAVSRRLVDFCGLEWNEAVTQFHAAKRSVATASYDQVRQPIYTTSRARWKNYEKYIGPLREALGDCVDSE
jgi:tetratricopeptide (TPR) repeat protein